MLLSLLGVGSSPLCSARTPADLCRSRNLHPPHAAIPLPLHHTCHDRLPAAQVTNRRVNALENVTIPRMEGVISYINRELDELER